MTPQEISKPVPNAAWIRLQVNYPSLAIQVAEMISEGYTPTFLKLCLYPPGNPHNIPQSMVNDVYAAAKYLWQQTHNIHLQDIIRITTKGDV